MQSGNKFPIWIIALLCFFACDDPAPKQDPQRLIGVWQQKSTADEITYLHFDESQKLNVYRKYQDVACLVVLIGDDMAMPFREKSNGVLEFNVMGHAANMRYRIRDDVLMFRTDVNGGPLRGHEDFLDSDYDFVGSELTDCLISYQEWKTRIQL